ncbi:MAG: UbiX family flavin prenyltransferase [Planctomycetota bacterium]|jgi:4-hydroxy-3-polyprenylbenzoate decarboxylase
MASFFLGLSGGSGAPIALRLMEVLLARGDAIQLAVSGAGRQVLRHEAGIPADVPDFDLRQLAPSDLRAGLQVHDLAAVAAAPASGSADIDAVILCPCSMGTLARVAHGFSSNLIERAADVALKEGRRLIMVPRETPLSSIHLRNMTLLAEAGAVILPAMPGWYHRPERVEDLIDFVVARIMDTLGIEHQLVRRWQTPETNSDSPWDEGELAGG